MNDHTQESWKPLISIALTMTMVYITSFSINVLISAIVGDLGTTVAHLQLVIVAASLIGGALMVTAGRLGDKLGKKKVYVAGIVIYAIGLALVVLSPNTTVFTVAWAVIWPAGMVLIIPTTVAMIMYYYQGTQRAVAFGIYGAVLSAVSAVAPIVVGYLASQIGWRPALALSPIVGIIALLSALALDETDRDPSIKIDKPSVLLSVAGFGLFLIATTMAGTYGWILEKRPMAIAGTEVPLGGLSVVPVLFLVSVLLLVAFFLRGRTLSRKGDEPLLDATILRNLPFTVGMSITALFFLVNAGILFVVSVFLQAGAKFDSFATALTTLPYTACVAVFSLTTPKLGKRIPPKWILVAGFAGMMAGTMMIGRTASTDMVPMDLLPGMLLLGIGSGFVMAQAGTVTMWTVKPEESGAASGLSETLKEILGQGFAVALAGSILFGAVYGNMVREYERIEGIELGEAERQTIVIELEDTFQEITEAGEQEFIATLPDKTQQEYAAIVDRSAEGALRTTLWVMNVFIVVSLLLSLAVPGKRIEEGP